MISHTLSPAHLGRSQFGQARSSISCSEDNYLTTTLTIHSVTTEALGTSLVEFIDLRVPSG